MSEKLRKELESYLKESKILLKKIDEFQKAPDLLLIDTNDILSGLGKVMKAGAAVLKSTPLSWLSWILSLGGLALEKLGKKKETKDVC